MKKYNICDLAGGESTVELSEHEWFEVFLTGRYQGTPIQYIEPLHDCTKRVTFRENLNGSQPS